MKYCVVCVRDTIGETFAIPFFVPSLGIAQRSFADEVNRADEKNLVYMHPDDFELYELGTYDDAHASVEWLDHPRRLLLGRDCKVRSDP